MKSKRNLFSVWSYSLAILVLSFFAGPAVEGASTVLGGTTLQQAGMDPTTAFTVGQPIPLGQELKTGAGQVIINLEDLATVTVSPNSVVRLGGVDKKARTCSLTVTEGTIAVKTEKLPAFFSVVATSPAGSGVTAGGTFTLAYEKLADKVTEKVTFTCTSGEVTIAGKYISTPNDTLRSGGSLSFTLVDSPKKKCVYFSSITVQGQDLNVAMGGGNMVTINAASVVEGAMNYGFPNSPFSALAVKKGTILVGGLEISEGMAPLFVRGDSVVMGSEDQQVTEPVSYPKTPQDMITAHDKDRLVIADKEFQNTDLVLYSDEIIAVTWLRDDVEFTTREFLNMPTLGVENLIIGAGPEKLITVPRAVLTFLSGQGITVRVVKTDQAVLDYNKSVEDGKGATTTAIIILEDYENAEDYLGDAREAAAGSVDGSNLAGPLPSPSFVPSPTPSPTSPLPPIPNYPEIPDIPDIPDVPQSP